MKNKYLCILGILVCTAFVSCGNNSNGTYYPEYNEMSENLESKGYTVICEDDCSDFSGKVLTATKKDEFIEFYWLNNSEHNNEIESKLQDKYTQYDRMINIQNDDKYGNLVFCSSSNASDDAGINIFEVKVK